MANYETSHETFVNPYHFIPLEDKCEKGINYEELRAKNDLKTGWIECEIETKTPIFIPNTTNENFFDTRKNISEMNSYDFFSYNDLKNDTSQQFHTPVIPGSSIRGAIRSAFESVTNSCMSTTDHKHYLYKRFAMQYKNAGRITKTDNKYVLQPCSMQKKKHGDYADNRTSFEFQGEIGIKGKRSKKIFAINNSQNVIELSSEDITLFKKILELYRDKRINKKLGNGPKNHHGFSNINNLDGALVFYEYKNNRLYISPAQIGKEVFHEKLADIIDAYKPCDSLDNLCPACSIFGIAGENDALASLIRFSDGELSQKANELHSLFKSHGILPELASPKESATEFYLKKQSDNHDIWNYDYAGVWKNKHNRDLKSFEYDPNYKARIQGRKMYWHQKSMVSFIDEKTATKRNVMIRPVKDGIQFKFKIHFSFLSDKEIQKLLWTLTIGNSPDHAHKIGMGKPLGLGSIKVNVNKVQIRNINIDGGFNYKIDNRTDYYIETASNDAIFENHNSNIINAFLTMTQFEDAQNNIQYPVNVESDGKHYEWFSANKTDHFSPTIVQSFESISDSKPDLKKFKLAPKKKHNQRGHNNSWKDNPKQQEYYSPKPTQKIHIPKKTQQFQKPKPEKSAVEKKIDGLRNQNKIKDFIKTLNHLKNENLDIKHIKQIESIIKKRADYSQKNMNPQVKNYLKIFDELKQKIK